MENTGEKRISPRLKTVLVIIAAVVAVLCIIVVVTQLVGSTKARNNSIAVYRKESQNIIRINDMEISVSDLSASDFKCDKENGRVFYTVDSSYADGLYDLYFVELKRSEIMKPRIIDYGISKGYNLNSGKVYYLKVNSDSNANDGCVCDIDSGKIEVYSENVEKFYPLEYSDVVYFTKMHGDNRVLYKYASSSPIEVCRDINLVNIYNNGDVPHILYEKDSAVYSGMTELYIAYAEGAPELISDNTYDVKYDSYFPGGNLYYFTSSGENISWSYVIADAHAEADKTIVEPKRSDFFSFFGISTKYNEALREYQDKLVRDEIREALTESVEKSVLTAPVFTAYVFNESGSHKLAEKIDPTRIFSVSVHGEPKMIYEANEVTQSSTDMDALVEIAQRSTMSEVIDYARNIVDKSVVSLGVRVSVFGKNGLSDYPLDGYNIEKTSFSFSENGNRIYALVRDIQGDKLSLYTNGFDENLAPTKTQNVDNGISAYRFIGDSVMYFKDDIGKNTGDIFAYSGEKPSKISNAASSFMVKNTDDIYILKNYNSLSSAETADYYCYVDSKESLVDEKIDVESFVIAENGNAAYIAQEDGVQKLFVYSNGKTSSVTDNVDKILFFE